jgi:glycosyltransferase involved in cell wall biosynthesis
MDPELSIVIVTWNRMESLRMCILHLLSNTRSPFEIIVVDNGSQDGTSEMVSSEYPDIKLITLPENIGVCERNRGFDIARGKWIGEIDDDVYVWPSWDRIILSEFTDEVGIVGPQGFLFRGWEKPNIGKMVKPGQLCDFLTGFCFIMRNVGIGYDRRFNPRWHGDLDLSFQFLSAGWKIRVSRKCGVHPSMMQGVDWALHDDHLELIREKWSRSSLEFVEFDQEDYLRKQEDR